MVSIYTKAFRTKELRFLELLVNSNYMWDIFDSENSQSILTYILGT